MSRTICVIKWDAYDFPLIGNEMDDETRKAELFLELLRPIEGELENYCRRMVWNRDDAADTLQNAVLRGFRAFDRYHADASFRAWMFKIVTNEAFASNRKYAKAARLEFQVAPQEMDAIADSLGTNEAEPEPHPSLEAVKEALDDRLVHGLKMLTEKERALLLLRVIAGFSYDEMAKSLEVPKGTVMGNLARARQKMRKVITKSPWKGVP